MILPYAFGPHSFAVSCYFNFVLEAEYSLKHAKPMNKFQNV